MKIKVEMHDEVYYPVVSIARAGMTEPSIEEPITVVNQAITQSVTESDIETKEVQPTVLADTVKKIDESKQVRSRRGWKMWGSRLGWCVVAVIVVCATALVGMRLAGFRTFTVMSGSMDPEYPVGAMIYVQPVDYQTLKVGDVISYVANDDKTVVTHRIVSIEVDEKDASVWRFKTKGDANNTADAKLVHYKNVLGTPVIVVPFIGYFAHNIQQPPGVYIALVVGTLLLAWTFLPGTLEERRKTARKSVAN